MTTTTYTETQAAAGFFGYFDLVNNSSRRSWTGIATWSGYITGTDATLRCGSGDSLGPYWVSVDFAEETQPTIASNLITLFTGLSDTAHFVRIRADNGHTTVYNYTFVTGVFLSVTGAAPAIAGLGANGISQFLGDPSAPLQHTFTKDRLSTTINTAGTTPVYYWNIRTGLYNNQGAVRFRAKASEIWIYCADSLYLTYTDRTKTSIDLSSSDLNTCNNPSYANLPTWRRVLTGCDLSNFHTYQITPKGARNNSSVEGIMIVGSGCAFTTLTEQDICYQYGDSITAAFNSGSVGEDTLDTYQYCAAMGLLGSAKGHAGIGAQQLYEELSAATTGVLANNWQIGKCATIGIGTNDTISASSTTATTTSATGTAGTNVITLAGTSSGWAVGQFFSCPTAGGAGNGGYISSMGTSSGGNGTINLSRNLVSNITAQAASGYPFKVSLLNLINLLLTYGHQKIAVRACSTNYGTGNLEQEICNVVQTLGNANVQYFGGSYPTAGTNLWTGISTLDGLHPDAAGYVTYAAYEAGSTGYRSLFAAQVATIDNETGTLVDTQTYAPGALALAQTETGTAADTSNRNATLQKSVTETGTATDTQSSVLTFVLSRTEAGTALETVTVNATIQTAITEALNALDTQGTGTFYSLSQTETGSALETVVAGATLQNSIAEALSGVDSSTGVTLIALAQTETGTASNTQAVNATIQAAIVEALTALDTQGTGTFYALAQAETGNLIETVSANALLQTALTEALSAADTQGTGTFYALTQTESGTAVDTQALSATLQNAMIEALSGVDTSNFFRTVSSAASESANASDFSSTTPVYLVGINEAGNAVDFITVTNVPKVLAPFYTAIYVMRTEGQFEVPSWPYKTPAEIFDIGFDFSKVMDVIETIQSASITTKAIGGEDQINSLLRGSMSTSGAVVRQSIGGGTLGVTYVVSCVVTFAPYGRTFELERILLVSEL